MGEDWTLEWALFKSPSISIHFKNVVKNIHSGTLEFQNNQTFEQKLIEKLKDKSLKKTEIAYQLAQMLQDDLKKDVSEILIDENDQNIKYLINAIKYAANEN
jgi:putative ATP-dependent endonuclease of OLD family